MPSMKVLGKAKTYEGDVLYIIPIAIIENTKNNLKTSKNQDITPSPPLLACLSAFDEPRERERSDSKPSQAHDRSFHEKIERHAAKEGTTPSQLHQPNMSLTNKTTAVGSPIPRTACRARCRPAGPHRPRNLLDPTSSTVQGPGP